MVPVTVSQYDELHVLPFDRHRFQSTNEGLTFVGLTRIDDYHALTLQDVTLIKSKRDGDDIDIHVQFFS